MSDYESRDGSVIPDPSRPEWKLTHEQAQQLIQLLFARNRATFGKLHYEIWTGEPFTARRARGQ